MTKILDPEILNSFCSSSDHRIDLSKPFLNGEYVFATDTYSAIRVKSWYITGHLETIENSLIKKLHSCFLEAGKTPKEVPTLQWQVLLDDMKTANEWKDGKPCEECDGEGITYCEHCESESDCKTCNGRWKTIPDKKTGRKIFEKDDYISINQVTWVNPIYIQRVLTAFFDLNKVWILKNQCQLYTTIQDEKSPILFTIHNRDDHALIVEMLVMPVTQPVSEIKKTFYTMLS